MGIFGRGPLGSLAKYQPMVYTQSDNPDKHASPVRYFLRGMCNVPKLLRAAVTVRFADMLSTV